jgi:hypothetical protein
MYQYVVELSIFFGQNFPFPGGRFVFKVLNIRGLAWPFWPAKISIVFILDLESLLSKNDFYLDSILGERQPELLVGKLAE